MTRTLAMIGFGEAGQAFATGILRETANGTTSCEIRAFDRKTTDADPAVADAKRRDYAAIGITGCATGAQAVAGADAVFSLVTADQSLTVARETAGELEPGALFMDGNSVAPGTKQAAAQVVEAAGGSYVDCAIMAPVHPRLHKAPLLLSGPHTDRAAALCAELGMAARVLDGPVGLASSVKMIRSVMMKGLEGLVAECVLAGRKAGVEQMVLDSLEVTYPGFGWHERSAYMLERMTRHGARRAAEMEEVAKTVRDLGFSGAMADATVGWERTLGALGIDADATEPAAGIADRVLAALETSNPRGMEKGI